MFKKLILVLVVLLLITTLSGCFFPKTIATKSINTEALLKGFLEGDYEIGDTVVVRGKIDKAFAGLSADLNPKVIYSQTKIIVFCDNNNNAFFHLNESVLTKVGKTVTIKGVIRLYDDYQGNSFDLIISDAEIIRK